MIEEYRYRKLIDGCRKGDPESQRALVEKFSGLIYIICKRYLNNEADVKDAMQESLLRIFKNINKYDCSKGELEPWVSTISIRHCLSELKKRKLEVISMDKVAHLKDSFLVDPNVMDKFDEDDLIQIISELPDLYRVVFNLAEIDGYNHKEIASMLNISITASRTRLNRAKNILKTIFNSTVNSESWIKSI